MFNYAGDHFEGTDGKYYMIGAEKLGYPMGSNDANYEVKYIELLDKHKQQPGGIPSLMDEGWDRIGHYKASNGGDAIAQGTEELQRRGIYPSYDAIDDSNT